MNLMELIAALRQMEAIPTDKFSKKETFMAFGEFFQINLNSFNNELKEMKNRNRDVTKFLDSLPAFFLTFCGREDEISQK